TIAGLEGIMICRTNNDYVLFDDNKLVAIAPLRKLIETYPNTFAAAFPPSYTPIQRYYRVWIATDTQRNIWLAERTFLAAFTGSRWLTSSDVTQRVPALRSGTGAAVLLSVGDGNRIYFTKALAKIEDGTI